MWYGDRHSHVTHDPNHVTFDLDHEAQKKSDQRCADRQNFSSTVVRNFVNYCALQHLDLNLREFELEYIRVLRGLIG